MSNKVNLHQKPKTKHNIDAKKPSSDKLPIKYFFGESSLGFRLFYEVIFESNNLLL